MAGVGKKDDRDDGEGRDDDDGDDAAMMAARRRTGYRRLRRLRSPGAALSGNQRAQEMAC